MAGSGCSGRTGLDATAAAAALLFFSADFGAGAGPFGCACSISSSSAGFRPGDWGGDSSSDEKSPFVAMVAYVDRDVLCRARRTKTCYYTEMYAGRYQ